MELLIFFAFIEWTYLGVSDWEIEPEVPDLNQSFWVEELAISVSAACEEHGKVVGDGDVHDLSGFVRVFNFNNFLSFEVVVDQTTLVGTVVD